METYFGVTAKIADLDKEDAIVLQSELLDFLLDRGLEFKVIIVVEQEENNGETTEDGS
jgi:hypothetical protein